MIHRGGGKGGSICVHWPKMNKTEFEQHALRRVMDDRATKNGKAWWPAAWMIRRRIRRQERVAIVTASTNDPPSPWPMGDLDSKNEKEIVDFFNHLKEQHEMTAVVVTHDS